MGERIQYELAINTAEVMYALIDAEYQRGERDLDEMMRRLKNISAYSLTHAEIMDQREGPEMLALAMFFGFTSDSRFHHNQKRIGTLSEETLAYPGQSKIVEDEVARRMSQKSHRKKDSNPDQPRLF